MQPGNATYSATKVFATYIGKALNYELKDKIDVLSFNPAGVATKLTKKKDPDMTTISAARAAEVAFRDLGHTSMTNGAARHEILTNILYILPVVVFNKICYSITDMVLKKIRKR